MRHYTILPAYIATLYNFYCLDENIVSKFYVVAAFLSSTAIMFAQPENTSDGAALEGTDNQLPISDYLYVLVVISLVFVYFKFRNIQKNRIQG